MTYEEAKTFFKDCPAKLHCPDGRANHCEGCNLRSALDEVLEMCKKQSCAAVPNTTRTAYIVKKQIPVKIYGMEEYESITTMDMNEGVFETEDLAKEYIAKRKALKDRDDKGCKFSIEPWTVMAEV